MTEQTAMRMALEALENSVDLVIQDAYSAEQLYGNYPARQAKVGGLKLLAEDHQKAITAIKAALEAKDDKRTQIEPWAIREEQVCPNKVCWHPYHCENGRCVEAENNVFLSKSYQKEKNCE